MKCSAYGPYPDLADATCPKCEGAIVWVDEIATGWNGALSDQGTGMMIAVCEECGEEYDDHA